MNLVVVSGKGGTGKTTLAVNLAYVLGGEKQTVRLLDCDVEEPNAHLFVKPRFTRSTPITVNKPVWDQSKCLGCGKCAENCHYNAIVAAKKKVLLFKELCHGCGVCTYVCPQNAFTEKAIPIGEIHSAENHHPFSFVEGVLNIGETLVPPIIREVKHNAIPKGINIIDASPGTACPVVEAMKDGDVVILVTEPTPFGLHDLKLAVHLTIELGIPAGIVINRSYGADDIIRDYAKQANIPILGMIPFRQEYAVSCSSGDILAEKHPELQKTFQSIFDKASKLINRPLPTLMKENTYPAEVINPKRTTTPISSEPKRHKEVTFISGKGGTGKTTIVAALSQLVSNVALSDTDVDASDLHLLLKPQIKEAHDFTAGQKASIDPLKCNGCSQCAAVCRFEAVIKSTAPKEACSINPLTCEGCGYCQLVCPEKAIELTETIVGQWFLSDTDIGPMVHAQLGIAEENSGKLVTKVRTEASELSKSHATSHLLSDGPPGTGCPVIASITGTDMVVIISEPSVSGIHDLERTLQLTNHFNIQAMVVINKWGLNKTLTQSIEQLANKMGSTVLGKIPFDLLVHEALIAGKTITDYKMGPAAIAIHLLWEKLHLELLRNLSGHSLHDQLAIKTRPQDSSIRTFKTKEQA